MAHIGDVDTYLDASVFQVLNTQCIVKVLGRQRVDGEGGHLPHVAADVDLLRGDFAGQGLGFGQYVLGKGDLEAVVDQDRLHLDVARARLAEYGGDLAADLSEAVELPVHDLDYDLFAVLCADQFGAVYGYADRLTARPVYGHLGVLFVDVEGADEVGHAAFEHLDDLALGLAAVAGGPVAHLHLVAVLGLLHPVLGDVDIVLLAVKHDVGRAAAGHVHPAFGKGGRALATAVVVELVAVVVVALDLAGAHQFIQGSLYAVLTVLDL